jgi:hypothetical protein
MTHIKIWVTFLGPKRCDTFEDVDETGGFQNAKPITLGTFPALFPNCKRDGKITLGKFPALFSHPF